MQLIPQEAPNPIELRLGDASSIFSKHMARSELRKLATKQCEYAVDRRRAQIELARREEAAKNISEESFAKHLQGRSLVDHLVD